MRQDTYIIHTGHPEGEDHESPDSESPSFSNAIEEYLDDNECKQWDVVVAILG